ncbi:MAG: hypothetical protein IH886_04410 [Nitrospinae bacterium]|nr:hypothetical protein [Nitrospinota bacterium]
MWLLTATTADAHRSGCHRWHSCPSDRGTYICGDTGHCSQCPDNQYCEGGRPRTVSTPDPKPKALETSSPLWNLQEVPVKPTPKKPEKVKKGESFHRDRICKKWNGTPEYTLDDWERVDCLTDQYAVEFDFSNKWAEAVGQALYYSMKTGKKAGIVLIMNGDSSQSHLERLKAVIGHYRLDIKIWTLKDQ